MVSKRRRGIERAYGLLLVIGGSCLLLSYAGCQSIHRLPQASSSAGSTTDLSEETPASEAKALLLSDQSSGAGSATVAVRAGSPDYPKFLQIPIFISDAEIVPNEIELWLGQDVVLDIFNVGSRTQDFGIGRDTAYESGNPVGFEVDFFQGGMLIDGALGAVQLFELTDRSREGDAANYRGVMVLLPTDYARVLVQRQHELWIDNSLGPHTVGTYTLASIEFQVTREMLGEWTFASFAGEGDFYDNGVRGRLVVRSPFPLP